MGKGRTEHTHTPITHAHTTHIQRTYNAYTTHIQRIYNAYTRIHARTCTRAPTHPHTHARTHTNKTRGGTWALGTTQEKLSVATGLALARASQHLHTLPPRPGVHAYAMVGARWKHAHTCHARGVVVWWWWWRRGVGVVDCDLDTAAMVGTAGRNPNTCKNAVNAHTSLDRHAAGTRTLGEREFAQRESCLLDHVLGQALPPRPRLRKGGKNSFKSSSKWEREGKPQR